ncbi:MAG TPA: prolipoprotein diacylglyceryl transferase [Geminicoccaceae bacterium]|nr:prolipoprotein diacylglyceryl transferase [Geminicoccaceae bacterium]
MPLLALPFPAIDPVLIQIGPFAIRWYALAYIFGLVIGWQYLRRLVRRSGWRLTPLQIDDLLLYVTLGVVLGGRLGYILFYRPDFYLTDPLEILKVWQGGMSFHGGLLGVVAASILFARRRRLAILEVGDAIACAAPIGLLLGRLANFINGELWGRPSDAPWAMVFPGGGPQSRHPSQLYEAGLEGLLLLLVMIWLALRPRAPGSEGRLTGAFLIGYGIARSIAELFREPDAHLGFLLGGLTMGQLLSLPMVVIGIWLVARSSASARRASLERS